MRYRRNYVSGGTYFFTIALADRSSNLLTKHISNLRQAINYVKTRHTFNLDAFVILPEHLHILITLPEDDQRYSTRIRLMKSHFSRSIPNSELVTQSREKKSERGIWQRRFWEHTIRNEKDFADHIHYIHYNPVKHKHVLNPADWQYSSIHHYIKKGILNKDWSITR